MIAFFSRFLPDPNSGGGCRREAQMVGALTPLQARFFSWRDSAWFMGKPSRFSNYLKLVLQKKFHPYRDFWIDFYIDPGFRMKLMATDWIKTVKQRKDIDLAIIDDPLYFYPLVEYLDKAGIPIVALCQNIESLSYSQLKSKNQARLFDKEIDLFRRCSLVVTISREETLLLRNFDIPALYFPYYPVATIAERMLSIREKRQETAKEHFLLIGNAGNKVTLDGMTAVIQYFKNRPQLLGKEKLLVAGYWSPKFLKISGGPNIDILGDIPNAQLDEILCRTRAMLCYQEYGAGALTRIMEMLLAAVPVLANTHACRSYYHYRGVTEFSNLDDLGRIILHPPDLPISPRSELIPPDSAPLIRHIKPLSESRITPIRNRSADLSE